MTSLGNRNNCVISNTCHNPQLACTRMHVEYIIHNILITNVTPNFGEPELNYWIQLHLTANSLKHK